MRIKLLSGILCSCLLAVCIVGFLVAGGGQQQEPSIDIQREIAQTRELLKKHPKDASLHEQLSILYSAIGDDKAALSEIKLAVKFEPSEPFYHNRLGNMYEELGKDSDAFQSYTTAARLARLGKGDNKEWATDYSLNVGRLYQKKKQYFKAEQWYERSLSEFWAYRPEWRMTRTDHKEFEQGDPKQVEQFEHALRNRLSSVKAQLTSDRPTPMWIKGRFPKLKLPPMEETGASLWPSAKCAEAEIRKGASGAGLHYSLGTGYLHVGRTENAVIHLLAACVLDRKSVIAWDNLGWAYLVQGRFLEAAEAWRHGTPESMVLARQAKSAEVQWQRERKAR